MVASREFLWSFNQPEGEYRGDRRKGERSAFHIRYVALKSTVPLPPSPPAGRCNGATIVARGSTSACLAA